MVVQYTPMDFINKIRQNNLSYTGSYTKKVTEADSDVEKLQSKSETFKKRVKTLKKYTPGGISKDLLETQLEDLVKSYNDMKSSSDKVTDKDVQKQITKLEKLFSDNEKSLKKIGITKTDGKYAFSSDTFEDAADKDINAILVGSDSFISQVDKVMRKVEETADDAQYNITEHRLSRTLKYQESNLALAANMTLAGQITSALKSSDDLIQSGNLSDAEDQKIIKEWLERFAQSVYHSDASDENENVKKLNQLCLDHEEKLARLGLTFEGDPQKMTFDGDSITITSDEFKAAYNELFGSNAAFGNTVSEYCRNIFNDIVQPEKLGVSIIDEYA